MDNHNILIATDFSQKSFKIISQVQAYIQNSSSKLFIVHIIEDSIFKKVKELDPVKQNCFKLLQKNFPELQEHQFYCQAGSIDEQVAYFVDKLDISMVVLGNSGERNHLSEFFLGSNTKEIVRNTKKPSLVIKNDDALKFDSILIPTDLSDESKQFIQEIGAFLPEANIDLFYSYAIPFESRLSFYGLNKNEMNSFQKDMKTLCLNEAHSFYESLSLKNRINLITKEGGLNAETLTQESTKLQHDVIALHTTGHFSFFAFDVIDYAQTNILIQKID